MGEQVECHLEHDLPLRGAMPIALATVRSSHMNPGTAVLVNAEGETVPATVTEFDFEPPAADS